MYNRYVRSDNGRYERIPIPDPPPREEAPPPPSEEACPPRPDPWQDQSPPPAGCYSAPPPPKDREKQGLLSGLLGKLNLENIDTGDLLLLVILFLLFKDGEDEELLIALGLLLIL